jgi:hypothetical protein
LILVEKIFAGFDLAVEGRDLKSSASLLESTQQLTGGSRDGSERSILYCQTHKKNSFRVSPGGVLVSAHHSCGEISLNTGVISLSGGLKVNSITSNIYISLFAQFVNQDFQKDFSPLRIIGGCDIIRKKNPRGRKKHESKRR